MVYRHKETIMNYDPIYTSGIQKAINEKAGQRLTCDGQFGAKSQAALKVLQTKLGVPATGVYDALTYSYLDSFIKAKYLTFDSIKRSSASLGVQDAHIRTVCEVESNGAGFLPDGRVKILFERHHFLASIKKRLPAATVAKLLLSDPDIVSATPGGYVGNEGEYARFNRAKAIDEYSAIYATSFGLFQIMGFNYGDAGYGDIHEFLAGMCTSETNHLLAFTNFNKVYRKGVLWTALKNRDWATYALNYNGTAYAKNKYDTKLNDAFVKFSKNIFAY